VDLIDKLKEEHRVIREKLIHLGRDIELAPSKTNESLPGIKETLTFFTEYLIPHFKNEEDIIFTYLTDHKKREDYNQNNQRLQILYKVKKEHESIIKEIRDFEEEVAKMEEKKLFCDGVAISGMKLIHDLADHIRFEEEQFFPYIKSGSGNRECK